jgi:hypothetical protein
MKQLLRVTAIAAIAIGILLMVGGMWGMVFTYHNVARENITTPQDASIPNAPVRGPLTLKAQADIIRRHTLTLTGNKTFAEMPRQVPQFDEHGNPVLDTAGKQVMIANTTRDIWITATTLRTALHLAIVTYVFSGLIILLGCISIWTGVVFHLMGKTRS